MIPCSQPAVVRRYTHPHGHTFPQANSPGFNAHGGSIHIAFEAAVPATATRIAHTGIPVAGRRERRALGWRTLSPTSIDVANTCADFSAKGTPSASAVAGRRLLAQTGPIGTNRKLTRAYGACRQMTNRYLLGRRAFGSSPPAILQTFGDSQV